MKRWLYLLTVLMLVGSPVWAQGPRSTTNTFRVTNEGVTGTTDNLLAKIDANGLAVKAGTSDTGIDLYVVNAGGGTTGDAVLVLSGLTSCIMDNSVGASAGNYFVIASVTTAGRCHAQASAPTNGFVIGKMAQSTTTAGSAALIIALPQVYIPGASGAGSGTVNTGLQDRLAYYPANGTTVDDLNVAPTANKALLGNGTTWVISTADMAGAGVCTNQFVRAAVANAGPTCATVGAADVSNAIALTGTDIDTSSRVTGASVAFQLKGDNTPTALSGDVNDYSAGGALSTNVILHISGGASDRNITGLAAGNDGDLKIIQNSGTTNALVLKNLSTSSSAANRFLFTPGQTTAGDVTLQPGEAYAVIYDTTASQWRPFGAGFMTKDRIVPFTVTFGSVSADAAPLVADDDLPSVISNDYMRPIKIVGASCYVNTGTVTVTPVLTGGSATSILTGACSCGSAAFAACTINGTPTLNPYSANTATCSSTPCSADVNLTAVDGVAKYGIVKLVGVRQ